MYDLLKVVPDMLPEAICADDYSYGSCLKAESRRDKARAGACLKRRFEGCHVPGTAQRSLEDFTPVMQKLHYLPMILLRCSLTNTLLWDDSGRHTECCRHIMVAIVVKTVARSW